MTGTRWARCRWPAWRFGQASERLASGSTVRSGGLTAWPSWPPGQLRPRRRGRARGFQGQHGFDDSDVYKVLEGMADVLATHLSRALEAEADRIVALITAAQAPDGHLFTRSTLPPDRARWTDMNSHEMYTGGHVRGAVWDDPGFGAAYSRERIPAKTCAMEGHAVRAMYLPSGTADAALRGERRTAKPSWSSGTAWCSAGGTSPATLGWPARSRALGPTRCCPIARRAVKPVPRLRKCIGLTG